MTDAIQVLTTTSQQEEAERIARHLIQERLAACVQVAGPIHSTYWWQGQVETAEEWLVVAKTRQALYGQVEAAIRQVHSYEEPEILAVPIVAGSAGYLKWLAEQLNPDTI